MRTTISRRVRSGLIGLTVAFAIAGCSPSDRSGGTVPSGGIEDDEPDADDGDDGQSAIDPQGQDPDDRASAVGVLLLPATLIKPIDDPDVIAEINMLTIELVDEWEATPFEERERPGRWIELWDRLDEIRVDPDRVPLNLAPQWLIAAAESNQLTGCAQDWVDFRDEMTARLESTTDATVTYPPDQIVQAANDSLSIWLIDYVTHPQTSERAMACDE